MGILKVGVGAAQGVLADSWREYFYCDGCGCAGKKRRAAAVQTGL